MEANRPAKFADDNDILFPISGTNPAESVIHIKRDGDQAAWPYRAELAQVHTLNFAVKRDHRQITGGGIAIPLSILARDRHDGRDILAGVQVDEVDHRDTFRLAGCVRNLENTFLEHAAVIREKEHTVVGAGAEYILHQILIACGDTHHPAAAAALRSIGVRRQRA